MRRKEEGAMPALRIVFLALLSASGLVASSAHRQQQKQERINGVSSSAIIEADRRMMSRLETCYQKFKPEALLTNHRAGKWVTQIWKKDRMFGNLSRDAILLSLPTIAVTDFLEPNELKR